MKEVGVIRGAGFVRNGKTVATPKGGWQREYESDELIRRVERWIERNLAETDLRFPNA